MCRLLGVSSSGFYDFLKSGVSQKSVEDTRISGLIRIVHEESDGTYGSRRVMHALRQSYGTMIGRRRVMRLMQNANLQGFTKRLKRRVKQLEDYGLHACDRVNREWNPDQPNQIWVADITQISTWQGPLYLAVVMDVYSRKIVGWSMNNHQRSELVIGALEMAVQTRKPSSNCIHHSDHGSQYTSISFNDRVRSLKLQTSMGRVKTCYDNAVAESFFASLKKECTNRYTFPEYQHAQSQVFTYIETWYNNKRLHSKLGYQSPNNYEKNYAA